MPWNQWRTHLSNNKLTVFSRENYKSLALSNFLILCAFKSTKRLDLLAKQLNIIGWIHR